MSQVESYTSGAHRPKVIFLDAVGTLFGVKGSVGEVYREVAAQFGVDVAPAVLDRAFRNSFKAAGLPAFPGVPECEQQVYEFQWWLTIARHTFDQAGVLTAFSDFEAFFKALFAHFATAAPWVIYPDVIPALQTWRSQGIELGVLSNFDSRLYAVLKVLDLDHFFTSVTISTQVGVAKPDSQIFTIALQKHGCLPAEAWHIGDSHREDYEAACQVGLRGFWLRRATDHVPGRVGQTPIEPAAQAISKDYVSCLTDLKAFAD